MELNDWLAITGALRDWKLSAGIHILCKPQNARKENASADSVENENERKQVDWLEKRIVQCTAKSVERTALVSRSTSYMALSSLWMNWLQPMATTWLIFGFMIQENRLTAWPGNLRYWQTVMWKVISARIKGRKLQSKTVRKWKLTRKPLPIPVKKTGQKP